MQPTHFDYTARGIWVSKDRYLRFPPSTPALIPKLNVATTYARGYLARGVRAGVLLPKDGAATSQASQDMKAITAYTPDRVRVERKCTSESRARLLASSLWLSRKSADRPRNCPSRLHLSPPGS